MGPKFQKKCRKPCQKQPLPLEARGLPSNTWMPGPTTLTTPNESSIAVRTSTQRHNKVPIGYNGTPQIHPKMPLPFDDHHQNLIHPYQARPHSPPQTRVGIAGGWKGWTPQFMSTDSHFWVKICLRFQSLCKISSILKSDPPPVLLCQFQHCSKWHPDPISRVATAHMCRPTDGTECSVTLVLCSLCW